MIDDLDESLPLKVLNIPNIHANSLKVMLKYIYGCDLAIDRSVVIDLLLNGIYLGLTFIAQAAGKYIEESCIRYTLRLTRCAHYFLHFFSLSQFVTEENWFHLFNVSKKHSLNRLKSEVRRFVGSHLEPVSDQITFKVCIRAIIKLFNE